MKNLLVIFTPLQFLNALDYIKSSKEDYELLVLTTNKINIEQIKKLDKNEISSYPLERFNFVHDEALWFSKLAYARYAIDPKKYDAVIIGNFNNIVGYFLSVKFDKLNKKVTLLDDGLATIKIYLDRNRRNLKSNQNLFGGRWLKAYKKIFGIKPTKKIDRLNFYTSYDLCKLVESTCDQVKLIQPSTPSKNTILTDKNQVWFIGSPVVEFGIIERKAFDYLLEALKKELSKRGASLYYILHRSEKEKGQGLNYVKFDEPLEIVFEDLKTYPQSIISFYSSALVNLASAYPSLKCSYIDLSKIKKESKALAEVYSFLKIHQSLSEFPMEVLAHKS